MSRRKLIFLLFLLSVSMAFPTSSILINGMNGSMVFIDGIFRGNISSGTFKASNLPSKIVEVRLSRSGYADYYKDVDMTSEEDIIINTVQDPLSILKLNISQKNYVISYDYLGRNYKINSNNDNVYEIPSTLKKIIILKDDYFEGTIDIQLIPFSRNIADVNLILKDEILIDSNPSGAKVYSNFEFLGETPLKIKRDEYRIIELVKEGFFKKQLTIESSEKELLVKLDKGIAVNMNSQPSDAAIYVNGEFYDKTPAVFTLPTGNHIVEIKKTGYDSQKLSINLNENSLRNNYLVKLENQYKTIQFSNSENFKFNIDGIYLGKGISKIILDGNDHLLRISDGMNVYDFLIDSNFPNTVDLKNITVVNVLSKEKVAVNYLNKTLYTPANFIIETLFQKQDIILRTLGKSYIIEVEKNKSNDLILDKDIGYLNVAANLEGVLYYVNNVFKGKEKIFMMPLEEGLYEIKVVYQNKIYKKNIEIKNGEKHFEFFEILEKLPLRIESSKPFSINGENFLEKNHFEYFNKGPLVINSGMENVVIFFNEAQFLDIDVIK